MFQNGVGVGIWQLGKERRAYIDKPIKQLKQNHYWYPPWSWYHANKL